MIDYDTVTTEGQLRANLLQFAAEGTADVGWVMPMVRNAEYWLHDPASDEFCPVKFAGYVNRGTAEFEPAFAHGRQAWIATGRALNADFASDRSLSRKLADWMSARYSYTPTSRLLADAKFIRLPARDSPAKVTRTTAEPDRPKPRNWTREELIPALSLYCRLPFGKLNDSQPDIVAMAAEMKRTPASVSMKLCNFASMDPELQARGIKGLQGASELDRQVWDEFYGRWDVLAEAVSEEQESALMLQPASTGRGKKPRAALKPPTVTEGRASVKVRRGQAFFRQAVLAAYDGKCCITGISVQRLLRASHIVAWAADEGHRVNPCNGLALNVMHDAAFEGSGDGDERRPLMTLDEKCRVVLSKSLKESMPSEVYKAWFERFEGKRIAEAEKFAPDAGCLERHRARFIA